MEVTEETYKGRQVFIENRYGRPRKVVPKKCPVCREDFKVRKDKYEKRKTCSQSCSAKKQHSERDQKGEKNPNYDKGQTENWYERNKEQVIQRKKERRKKKKEWFRDYKKDKECVECGEDDWRCLVFDHENPSEKEYSISKMVNGGYAKETILEEIEKCEVKCANCHRKRTFKQIEDGVIA